MLNIPNDTGHPWRLNKFVEYQNKVPSIHPLFVCEYARRKGIGMDDGIILSWYTSVTYSEVTAVYLFEKLDWKTITLSELEEFWRKYKPTLIFGSARKHAKNADWFVPLMWSFLELTERQPERWLRSLAKDDPLESYKSIAHVVRNIRYVGRFAEDLFMEMLIAFEKIGVSDIKLKEPEVLDWKNCSNLTSAVFNILYMDEEADQFDKTGYIADEHYPLLQDGIRMIQEAIRARYPDREASLPLVIGKLCSFRNLFKASRYGGFHHDRQLGNIIKYQKNHPEDKELWDEMYAIRAELFHPSLLGEVGGWDGIRKERKKLWIEKGLTGVEDVPDKSTKMWLDEKKTEKRERKETAPKVSDKYAGTSGVNDAVLEVLKQYGFRVAQESNSPEKPNKRAVTIEERTAQDGEEMRNPISTGQKPRFMIVDPYSYAEKKRVDKTFPAKIQKAWDNKEIDFCYFPVEPFHYREVKRHATQMAVETCLKNNIPISMETRRAVPDWAVDALSRNKYSEIRISMNTLDEKKWKLLYPGASKPQELLDSFIRCFNGGAYTILKIAPIVPVIIEPFDVFQIVDMVKNWTEHVEVCFASFSDHDLELLKERVPNQFDDIKAYYRKINDRWYVVDSYRTEFLQKLDAFTNGWKLKLKILNEITADENSVTLLNIRSKKAI